MHQKHHILIPTINIFALHFMYALSSTVQVKCRPGKKHSEFRHIWTKKVSWFKQSFSDIYMAKVSLSEADVMPRMILRIFYESQM